MVIRQLLEQHSVSTEKIEMKFGRLVLQVNTHQLTECDIILSRRWRPWRPPAARCCICSSVR